MKSRLNPFAAAPGPMQAWLDFGKVILASGLEDSLMELVKIRASQINGCAHCLDMHIRAARPRFAMPKERGLEIAAAFFAASRGGDMQQLRSLLAADVTAYADGGGKTAASLHPIIGADHVVELHAMLAPIFARHQSQLVRYGFVNGLPGFVTVEQDTLQTTALQIEDGKIVAIYVMRNPEKLRHLGGPALH